MNIDKFLEKKAELACALLRPLVKLGFSSTRTRMDGPREIHDGFSMMLKCKDPKHSLKIISKVITIFEKNGMRVGLGESDDLSVQYIKSHFYATIGLTRQGIYVTFDEKPNIDPNTGRPF